MEVSRVQEFRYTTKLANVQLDQTLKKSIQIFEVSI